MLTARFQFNSGGSIAVAGTAVAALTALVLLASPTEKSNAAATDTKRIWTLLYPEDSSTDHAKQIVERAGGTLLANWKAVHIVVATTREPDFFTRVTKEVHGLRGIGRQDASHLPRPNQHEQSTTHDFDDWHMRMLHAAEGRAAAYKDPVKKHPLVAILDDPVDFSHPALQHAQVPNGSIDCLSGKPEQQTGTPSDFHGTAIAGVIAAQPPDGHGVTGVAPETKLLSISIWHPIGILRADTFVCAVVTAVDRGADIISASFATQHGFEPDAEDWIRWEAERRVIDYAIAQGVLVVNSIGNDGYDWDMLKTNQLPKLPLSRPGVVGAAGIDRDGTKPVYTSFGLNAATLTAPSGKESSRLTSTGLFGTWVSVYGTSFSAPLIAGVASLVKTRHPNMNGFELKRHLERTAIPIPCPAHLTAGERCLQAPGRNGYFGFGLADALSAVSD